MTDPDTFLTPARLHDLRSVGHHLYRSARGKGEDTSPPLAFLGAVTVALGCLMLRDAYRKTDAGRRGRSR